MNNQIPYTTFNDKSQKLCAPGNAVEFIQPWYTPISTTPENTGIAVGGIGNTFTLTPLGSTPNFSFIPGIFIDNNSNEFNFNDFYVSLADANSIENLVIRNFTELKHFLSFYPVSCQNAPLLNDSLSELQLLTKIKLALTEGNFYSENKEAFKRWNVEFSEKSKALLTSDETCPLTQVNVAVDFFNGLLINSSAQSLSLTATSSHTKITAIESASIDFKALYPMAEFDYHVFETVSIKRKVVSPVVKGDKKLCSLPIHWNEFELINNGEQEKTVTLVQSLKNLLGSTYHKSRPSVQDSACYLSQNPIKQKHVKHQFSYQSERAFTGVCLSSESPYASDIDGDVVFGIDVDQQAIEANKVTVTVKPSLYSNTEEDIILDALQTGRVNAHFDSGIYTAREALSAIVCIQVVLKPGESQSVRFSQVMDHSKIHLQDWLSEKAYVQYYRDHSKQNRAVAMMEDIVPQIDAIEGRIVERQNGFYEIAKNNFKDQQKALKFSTMAMNTLSFLAESSVWNVEDKFLVKECVDYPFFNSLDVYFYGSYSLLYLLPEIDGCVMKEFAKAILAEDSTLRRFWEYEDKPNAQLIDPKFEGVRAIRGAVIHDLGDPLIFNPMLTVGTMLKNGKISHLNLS
ncbi:GH116 family glycosyl-hydrolase [Psychromonas sp. KJ10-10]|uniref:GH116 family glycosyl-hydrolase n=1 Tax=Psychromonas sp. KJ10-10 TaxID=3391823 RepID=UPI0039B5C33D